MLNPWLSVPLEDYEGHMSSAGVRQLAALSELFRHALDRCRPESVAVMGIAGGNGLEHIDPAITERVVGVDINQRYLDAVRQRFGSILNLQVHCADIAGEPLTLEPVALVHAALILEHAGMGAAFDNSLSMVWQGGRLSIVLQLPGHDEQGVAATGFTSMQALRHNFALIPPAEFCLRAEANDFHLLEHETCALPAGKAFWHGIFTRDRRY